MERIPCDYSEVCPQQATARGCFEDIHHEYFPRRAYTQQPAKGFRELDQNKVLVCRDIHNEVHAVMPTPEMPTLPVMWNAINQARNRRRGVA